MSRLAIYDRVTGNLLREVHMPPETYTPSADEIAFAVIEVPDHVVHPGWEWPVDRQLNEHARLTNGGPRTRWSAFTDDEMHRLGQDVRGDCDLTQDIDAECKRRGIPTR